MPTGTIVSSTVPSGPVTTDRAQSAPSARIVTDAPGMGRCWASCTTHFTVPSVVAPDSAATARAKGQMLKT